jgi:hypothetical protein
MRKLEQAKSILELSQLSGRLANEVDEALERAKHDLNVENLQESYLKLQEWLMCRNELKERLDAWETN